MMKRKTTLETVVGYNDEVTLKNHFQAVGLISGLDLNWNLGCGWSILGKMNGSILYGQFTMNHNESAQRDETPFNKIQILKTKNDFRCSRGVWNALLGVQYKALVCDCKYGVSASLSWEQNIFFNQNQLWRVDRELVTALLNPYNNTGKNAFYQKKGDLDTNGLTLNFQFAY